METPPTTAPTLRPPAGTTASLPLAVSTPADARRSRCGTLAQGVRSSSTTRPAKLPQHPHPHPALQACGLSGAGLPLPQALPAVGATPADAPPQDCVHNDFTKPT